MAQILTDYQTFISLGILGLLFVGFATEILPPSAIAVCGAVTFLLLGYIKFDELLGIFSNSAPITIAAMFVISGALVRTGTLEAVSGWVVEQAETRPTLAMLAVLFCALLASAFVNNTPVVLVLIPIMARLAAAIGVQRTRLLIPLSYTAILGGTCTLVGTSTNLLVAGVAQDAGLDRFGIFEITPVGILVTLAGMLALLLLGPLLLPHRQAAADVLDDTEDETFLTEIRVPKDSDIAGKAVGSLGFLKPDGVRLLGLIRGARTMRRDLEETTLEAGDRLILSARESEILAMEELDGVEVGHATKIRSGDERIVAKAFVAPNRRGMRFKIANQWDVRRNGIRILGINRHRHSPGPELKSVVLRPADRLLIEGPAEAIARIGEDLDLVNIAETRTRPFRRAKAPIAIATLALVVGLAAFDVMAIGALAIVGIAVLLLTRCIDAAEAWESVDLELLVLIFGMLAIGVGLENAGAIKLVVEGLQPILAQAPYLLILIGLYALTSILTELVTNNAVAVVVTPVAISLAKAIEIDPRPLVIAIMFGASASFATPIGYQTNTLVYGAANYRFSDFLKIGVPMNIIAGFATCLAIALLMPA